jgi:hypothetical protein
MNTFWISTFILLLTSCSSFSQTGTVKSKKSRRGSMYFYWGWNRGGYSNSDIHFKAANYKFSLSNVKAKDKPIKIGFHPYLNPGSMTLPQYNFRIGYFFKDNYNISVGVDHMKYVVQADQTVSISGTIDSTETVYDGSYHNNDITIKPGFLELEHTDGLNFINVDVRRFDEMFSFKKIKFNLTEGIGAGLLYPRTDATVLNHERNNAFHVAGYGISTMVGINIAFTKAFFIQTEFKGGFINMPDIVTSTIDGETASQNFFFYQYNIVFGANINFKKNQSIESQY